MQLLAVGKHPRTIWICGTNPLPFVTSDAREMHVLVDNICQIVPDAHSPDAWSMTAEATSAQSFWYDIPGVDGIVASRANVPALATLRKHGWIVDYLDREGVPPLNCRFSWNKKIIDRTIRDFVIHAESMIHLDRMCEVYSSVIGAAVQTGIRNMPVADLGRMVARVATWANAPIVGVFMLAFDAKDARRMAELPGMTEDEAVTLVAGKNRLSGDDGHRFGRGWEERGGQ